MQLPSSMPGSALTLTRMCAEFCRRRKITVTAASNGSLVLANVPLDTRTLSKPRTNMCVAVEPDSRRILVFVDRDLQPTDPQSPQARLLTGTVKDDWQLVASGRAFGSADEAIMETVSALMPALAGESPEEPLRLTGRILPEVGRVIDPREERISPLHRDAVLQTARRLLEKHGRGTVVTGQGGTGLTTAALSLLEERINSGERAVRIDCGLIATDSVVPAASDERMRQLLQDCRQFADVWFFLDDLHWILRTGTLPQAALAVAIDRGLKLVCTLDLEMLGRRGICESLARRLYWVDLPAPDPHDVLEIVTDTMRRLDQDRKIQTEPDAVHTVVKLSRELPGVDPGRVMSLVEAAAVLAGNGGRLGPDEVMAASTLLRRPDE